MNTPKRTIDAYERRRGLYAHIPDALVRIESCMNNGREAFFRDPKIKDAVMRNLEVLGKAAKNLPADFRAQHDEVAWQKIALQPRYHAPRGSESKSSQFPPQFKQNFIILPLKYRTDISNNQAWQND